MLPVALLFELEVDICIGEDYDDFT